MRIYVRKKSYNLRKKQIPIKTRNVLFSANRTIMAQSSGQKKDHFSSTDCASAINPLCEHHRTLFGSIASTWAWRWPCDSRAFQVARLQKSHGGCNWAPPREQPQRYTCRFSGNVNMHMQQHTSVKQSKQMWLISSGWIVLFSTGLLCLIADHTSCSPVQTWIHDNDTTNCRINPL